MYRKRGYRRRARRAPVARKRRYTRKRTLGAKRRKNLQTFTYPLRATWNEPNFPPQSTGNTRWYTPSLDMANDTRYKNLYDEYRINWVKISITPFTDNMDVGLPVPQDGTPPTPYIYNYRGFVESVIDYNSPPTAADTATLNDYPSYKSTRMTKTHSRVFTPRIQTPVWLGGADISAFRSSKSGWISCAYGNVPHLGMFVHFPKTPINSTTAMWRINMIMSVTFRGIKPGNTGVEQHQDMTINTTAGDTAGDDDYVAES